MIGLTAFLLLCLLPIVGVGMKPEKRQKKKYFSKYPQLPFGKKPRVGESSSKTKSSEPKSASQSNKVEKGEEIVILDSPTPSAQASAVQNIELSQICLDDLVFEEDDLNLLNHYIARVNTSNTEENANIIVHNNVTLKPATAVSPDLFSTGSSASTSGNLLENIECAPLKNLENELQKYIQNYNAIKTDYDTATDKVNRVRQELEDSERAQQEIFTKLTTEKTKISTFLKSMNNLKKMQDVLHSIIK